MEPIAISITVLICIFASALLGIVLRPRFPDEHLNAETKETIKLVMGVIATMTGMVLGLLVASAKSSFDSQRTGVAELAANVIVLDRTLVHYGPDAQESRRLLRGTVVDMLRRIWPDEPVPAESSATPVGKDGRYDELYDRILALHPKTDPQRTIQSQALKIVYDTAQMRWLLAAQRRNSIPLIFLILLVAWLSITFMSYGLFAPRHATNVAVLLLGSFVVSSAVFLILELNEGFGGLIHISSEPLREALVLLGT